MSENRRGERRGGEEKEEEAVEVEIYSGIEFTRLNSTPLPCSRTHGAN